MNRRPLKVAVFQLQHFVRQSGKPILRIVSLSFFLFLVGCCPKIRYMDSDGPFYSETAPFLPVLAKDTLKVVSFNIEYGKRMEQAVKEFKETKELQDADIIFLQEIDQNDVAMLAKALQLNSIYYPSVQHVHGENFGNGILSRWPIKNHGKIILPYPNPICGHSRTAIFGDISLGNRTLRVYSTHTEVSSLGLEKRLAQFKTILSTVPDSLCYAIIGGDFNTMAESTIERMDRLALGKGFLRATKNIPYTVSSFLGALKFNLDHIYVRGFTALKSGIDKSAKSSDHQPVWVVLVKEKK